MFSKLHNKLINRSSCTFIIVFKLFYCTHFKYLSYTICINFVWLKSMLGPVDFFSSTSQFGWPKNVNGHWAKVMCGRFQVGQSPTSLNWNTLLGDKACVIMNEWIAFQTIVMCNLIQSIIQQSIPRSWISMHPSCVFGCVQNCIQTMNSWKGSFQLQVWTKPENLSLCWMTLFCVPFFKLPITLWYYSLLCFPFGK